MRPSIKVLSPWDADIIGWRNIVTTDGGTVALATQTALNTLAHTLKYNKINVGGVWTSAWDLLDYYIWYAADDFHGAKFDLKKRLAHTVNGAMVFTTKVGYQGTAGAGVYLDTNAPLQSQTKYQQDNHCSGGYVVATGANSSSNGFWGNNSNRCFFGRNGAAQYWYCDNNNTSTNINVTGVTLGHFHMQRTSSVLSTVYRNGGSISTQANVSSAIDAGNQQVFCRGGASNLSDVQLACHYFGASTPGLETIISTATYAALHAINPGAFP